MPSPGPHATTHSPARPEEDRAPAREEFVLPSSIRLDVSSACQLECPTCPTAQGLVRRNLGVGHLTPEAFRRLLDENPLIRSIELSNWGEIFLNPGLPAILELAYRRQVRVEADNGVNLNTASDEVLQAVVKYRLRRMTCSIDGTTQEAYATYRRKGDLSRVLANVERSNAFKRQYRSRFPLLVWQFVMFGHNEHQVDEARALARRYGMRFHAKLAWEDLYSRDPFSPIVDRAAVARASGLGAADRTEVRRLHGVTPWQRASCAQLWLAPQVHHDGQILGCAVNHWASLGNAFDGGLAAGLAGERIRHARRMLMGQAPPRDDLPCTRCAYFSQMQSDGTWMTASEVRPRGGLARLAADIALELDILLTRIEHALDLPLRQPFLGLWHRVKSALRARVTGIGR